MGQLRGKLGFLYRRMGQRLAVLDVDWKYIKSSRWKKGKRIWGSHTFFSFLNRTIRGRFCWWAGKEPSDQYQRLVKGALDDVCRDDEEYLKICYNMMDIWERGEILSFSWPCEIFHLMSQFPEQDANWSTKCCGFSRYRVVWGGTRVISLRWGDNRGVMWGMPHLQVMDTDTAAGKRTNMAKKQIPPRFEYISFNCDHIFMW